MSQVSVDKVSFGKLNDKNYYFTDGITSLPHGHPLLQEIYEHRVGKTESEIQHDGIIGERLEQSAIARHRRLFLLNRIFNSKIPSEGCTVREYLLNVISPNSLTLITKKFGRKNNSDKRVSENLTVRNFRRSKFFTSEIFPELFHRENENNIYFPVNDLEIFYHQIHFFIIFFFFYLMKFGLDYFNN